VRSLDTGKTRELHVNLQAFSWPRWAPDGRSFVSQGPTRRAARAIYLIDAQTGAATPVVTKTTGGNLLHPQWSPDGKRIYYVTNLPTPVNS